MKGGLTEKDFDFEDLDALVNGMSGSEDEEPAPKPQKQHKQRKTNQVQNQRAQKYKKKPVNALEEMGDINDLEAMVLGMEGDVKMEDFGKIDEDEKKNLGIDIEIPKEMTKEIKLEDPGDLEAMVMQMEGGGKPKPKPKKKLTLKEQLKKTVLEDKAYHPIPCYNSISILKQECVNIKTLLQQKKKLPAPFQKYYGMRLKSLSDKQSVLQLFSNYQTFIQKIYTNLKTRKMSYPIYKEILTKTLKQHKQLLVKAQKAGNGNAKNKIIKRIGQITDELKVISSKADQVQKDKRIKKAEKKTGRTFKLEYSEQNKKHFSKVPSKQFKAKWQKMNKEVKIKVLEQRINQYKNMCMYWLKNMKEEMMPVIKKTYQPVLEKAKVYLAKLQKGQESKNLFPFLLQKMGQITPEEFHPEGFEQRNLDLQRIFRTIEDTIDELDDIMKNLKETKAKRKFMQAVAEAKNLEDQNMKFVYEVLDNVWMPPPQIKIGQLYLPIVLEDKNIPMNQIWIKWKGIQGPQKTYIIKFSLDVNGTVQQFETAKSNGNQWNHLQKINACQQREKPKYLLGKTIRASILNYFNFYQLFLEFGTWYSTHCFTSTCLIKSNQQNGQIYAQQQIISSISNQFFTQYTIAVRQQLKRLKGDGMAYDSVKFIKKYPTFNKNAQTKTKKPKVIKQQKAPQRQRKTEKSQVQQKKAPAPKSKPKGPDLDLHFGHLPTDAEYKKLKANGTIPEGPNITLEDVLLPDDTEKSKCVGWLQQYSEQLEKNKAELVKIGGVKESRVIDKTWMAAFTWLNKLGVALQNQELGPPDYLKMLEECFQRDKALVLHYKKLQCTQRYKFVVERMKCLKMEIDSLKEMLG